MTCGSTASPDAKPNRNFGGFEFAHADQRPAPPVLWTRMKRSDAITEEQYRADPDKYYDNPNWSSTILTQLNHPETRLRGKLNVLWYSTRPAYDSWDAPMKAVHAKIVGAYHQLAGSPYPEHQELAAKAWAGDPEAYLDMLELNSAFDVRAADAPKTKAPPHDVAIHKYAYNGTGAYKVHTIASVRTALANDALSP
jgi:hypothetical protein